MKIHHLNCGTLCPFSFLKLSKPLYRFDLLEELVCHCLLIEDKNKLILVDTGLGLKDVSKKRKNINSVMFDFFSRPLLKECETAYRQILQLGFDPNDVTDIIATHFDLDHVGGVEDFPLAKLHLLKSEFEAVVQPKNWNESLRYPKDLLGSIKKIALYEDSELNGQTWNGWHSISPLEGIDSDIFLVPIPGHTRGHTGVVINDVVFFLGDALLSLSQLSDKQVAWWIELYNKKAHVDGKLYQKNLKRLIELYQTKKELKFHCSHDKADFFASLKCF